MSDEIQHKRQPGIREPHVDFDIEAVEQSAPERNVVAEVLGFILAPLRGRRAMGNHRAHATVVRRLLVVAIQSNPEVFEGRASIAALARILGVSERGLRKHTEAARVYWARMGEDDASKIRREPSIRMR